MYFASYQGIFLLKTVFLNSEEHDILCASVVARRAEITDRVSIISKSTFVQVAVSNVTWQLNEYPVSM